MILKNKLALVAILASIIPASASATLLNVAGPEVKAGRQQLELRTGYELQDEENRGAYRERLHYQYDFTDMFSLRLIAEGDKIDSDEARLKNGGTELKFQLFEDETDGFDGSIRLDYRADATGDAADSAGLVWLWQKKCGDFTLTQNSGISHQVGSRATDGISLDLRWQAMAPVAQKWKVGMEIFNQFGRLNDLQGFNQQRHRVGVVTKGKVGDVGVQLGYLAGISDRAPDTAFKLFLTYDF